MPLQKISFEYDITDGYRFKKFGERNKDEEYCSLHEERIIVEKIPDQAQSIAGIAGKFFSEGLNAENQNRRKHADLIHAWAEGAEIQFVMPDGSWRDVSGNPLWEKKSQYRIKPKTKTVRFRNGITKQGEVVTYQYGRSIDIEQSPHFKQWLEDWQEVEIEE